MANISYLGLFAAAYFAGMLFPLSSDVVLFSMVGFGYGVVPCLIVAFAGSWCGGMTNYFLGYLGKWEWIEKYLKVRRSAIERQQQRLSRHGLLLGGFSWLPVLGVVFPLALGFFRINKYGVGLCMAVGQICRYAVAAFICVRFVR